MTNDNDINKSALWKILFIEELTGGENYILTDDWNWDETKLVLIARVSLPVFGKVKVKFRRYNLIELSEYECVDAIGVKQAVKLMEGTLAVI